MQYRLLKEDGTPLAVGDTVIGARTGSALVVLSIRPLEVKAEWEGHERWYDKNALTGLTVETIPDYWIMNRDTGLPVVNGDRVVGTSNSVHDMSRDHYNQVVVRYGNTNYWGDDIKFTRQFEKHKREFDVPHPVMPSSRIMNDELEILFDDVWTKASLIKVYVGIRYDTRKFVVWNEELVDASDFVTDYSGRRRRTSDVVAIEHSRNLDSSQLFARESETVMIEDETGVDTRYLREHCYYLADVEEWVLELPEDYVQVSDRRGNNCYMHEDECVLTEDGVWVEAGTEVEFDGCDYSQRWIDRNTFVCDSCDERMHNDNYDEDGDCCDCSNGDRRIRNYSDKTANRLRSEENVPIKFGIELEVEPKDRSDTSLSVFEGLFPSDYVVYKEDGSLDDGGFEIVTRPDSPAVHKRVFGEVLSRSNVRSTTTSWQSGNCGMHVHVSRKPLSELWIGRIAVLIQSKRMTEVVKKVAGRYNSDYCSINGNHKLTDGKKGKYCGRGALNLSNDCTIEFRIFRGTLNREGFLKNVEFVEAVLAYCRPAVCSNSDVDNPELFLRYVKDYRKLYPNLYTFLIGKSFYSEADVLREKRKLDRLAASAKAVAA